MNTVIPIISAERQCNGCTACCEGWLAGDAHGQEFWPGRKCHFLGDKSCSIYEQRPENPCKTFKCKWLEDKNFPEWLKPNLSKVIIYEREIQGHTYWEIVEAGEKMDSTILSWIFMQYVSGSVKNLHYRIDSGWNMIGSDDWIRAMKG
jgi:hypothetical protein